MASRLNSCSRKSGAGPPPRAGRARAAPRTRAGEAVEFLLDVDLLQVEHDFLLEPARIEWQLRLRASRRAWRAAPRGSPASIAARLPTMRSIASMRSRITAAASLPRRRARRRTLERGRDQRDRVGLHARQVRPPSSSTPGTQQLGEVVPSVREQAAHGFPTIANCVMRRSLMRSSPPPAAARCAAELDLAARQARADASRSAGSRARSSGRRTDSSR